MYASLRFSMMIEEMPARCRSRASARPAGPAPMIPTCVRMIPPDRTPFCPLGRANARGQGTFAGKAGTFPSARPAVARNAPAIVAVALAVLRREIALLAPDHADMQRDGERRRHHQRPV